LIEHFFGLDKALLSKPFLNRLAGLIERPSTKGTNCCSAERAGCGA
jgi:hypothetical protein